MRLDPADLSCDSCDAAVHPFVAACPACGAPHPSHLADAIHDPDLGIAALTADADVLDNVRKVVNYYRLREGGAPEDLQLAEGLGIILGIVGYKVVDGETTLGNASVTLEGEEIVIRDAGRGSGRAATTRIPLWSLLAADGTGGRLTLHRSGAAPLVIRGRGGLLASKPRPDHYLVLERWLAPAAAAAAERRWTAIGAAAHAAEIGVVATDEPGGPEPGPALAGVAPVGATAWIRVRCAPGRIRGRRAPRARAAARTMAS